jgi:hypothetical protein
VSFDDNFIPGDIFFGLAAQAFFISWPMALMEKYLVFSRVNLF